MEILVLLCMKIFTCEDSLVLGAVGGDRYGTKQEADAKGYQGAGAGEGAGLGNLRCGGCLNVGVIEGAGSGCG